MVGGEAHFAHIPSVSLEWDQSYLQDLAATDPKAVHVLVRDQAGFHLRDGDERLPERVSIRSTLQRFWDDTQSVLRLIGRDWFLLQLNASQKTRKSL